MTTSVDIHQTGPAVLPPALRGWADLLALLADDVAIALGPLVAALNQAMPHTRPLSSDAGEVDGYDGLSPRGDLAQLLISEWAIAHEYPDEFVRRFATSELLYLKPALKSPRPPGRIVALVDSGPSQLGARRIAHLATLLVLARRAEQRGLSLTIGVLGNQSEDWIEGNTRSQLTAWLRSRRPTETSLSDIEGRLTELSSDDTVWVLANTSLARLKTNGIRVHQFETDEAGWGQFGPTRLLVKVDRAELRLPLPTSEVSIRVLRGSGWKTTTTGTLKPVGRTPQPDGDANDEAIRFPLFAGAARRLIGRISPDQLGCFAVPTEYQTTHLKRYRFSGDVLATMITKQRIIALVEHNDVIKVEIVGKKFGNLEKLFIPRPDFPLDADEVHDMTTNMLTPMFFHDGTLFLNVAGKGIRIGLRSSAHVGAPIALLGYSDGLDLPFVALEMRAEVTYLKNHSGVPDFPNDAQQMLCGAGTIAIERPGNWEFRHGNTKPCFAANNQTFGLEPGQTAKGLVLTQRGIEMVTLSIGAQLIGLVGPGGHSVITDLSGDVLDVAVHPTLPLIAVQYRTLEILVYDANRRVTVARVKPESS
jgi:hypothetical protein